MKHHVAKKALPTQAKELKGLAALPPLEKELIEEDDAAKKKKDEFFNEEDMKEFSVKDEEEDLDEDQGAGGEGEPAWSEEEY